MKKILLALGFLVLLGYRWGWAEDRVSNSPLSVNDPEEFLTSAPFFYSYESGQWVTSSPGRIFTTVDQPPDFTFPFLKEKPEPIRYPRWALGQSWEGNLIVAIEIRENGAVGRSKVMQSSGHESLDQAAVKAIQKWRFEPGKKKGIPLVSCIQIPIRFVIDKD